VVGTVVAEAVPVLTLDAATGFGTDAGSVTCPPHPASAIKAAMEIRTGLRRNMFFTSLILETLSEWQVIDDVATSGVYREAE
jgi:hypothetical protein